MAGPLTPPVGTRFSTGEDIGLLSGPTTPPTGAIVVNPGTNLATATSTNPAGTTFYLTAGTHVLGSGAFEQVHPKDGNTYIGAPGAVFNGQGIQIAAFSDLGVNVTIRYLEITNFPSLFDAFVVNHDTASGWLIEYCQIHHNNGAGVGMGSNCTTRYCWLHDNGQYGFSVFNGTTPPVNVTVDHCEIAYNGTLSDEVNPDGSFTGNGRNGVGKFWECTNIVCTNNWAHNSNVGAIWADMNNVGMLLENNLIEDGWAEGFMFEISYNFLCRNNTFRRNGIGKGKLLGNRGDNFPVAAIYLSEAGSDPAVGTSYNTVGEVTGNTFINNWGDITLWENADRFTNSPTNPGKGVSKHPGASLAACNNPVDKVLTVSLTVGSPLFTVTGGALEYTDEGRSASGSGIPSGTSIAVGIAGSPAGFISSTQGRLTANVTATATGVTVTLPAGSINVDPAYTACRWHTQNILIHGNTFSHDPVVVLAGAILPAGVRTGKIALISNYGTYPSWSPYQGTTISNAITFHQNNVWQNNTYTGPYTFMPFDTSGNVSFAQWQAAPYNQDSGSTFSSTPGGSGGSSITRWSRVNNVTSQIGSGSKANLDGSVVAILGWKAG